jgi:signal transduction histidine kinase
MIRNPEELSLAIKSAVDRRAVLFSHLLLAAAMLLHTVFWSDTEPYEKYVAIFLSGSLMLMLFFRVFDLASINKRPLLYVVLYQLLTFIGIAFLTEPASPYVLVGMLSAMIANVYYGAKGIYTTVLVFGVATVVKYFVLASERVLSTNDILDIFGAFFVFWAISSFYVNVQAVYDWDRTRLKQLIREAKIGQQRLTTLINNMNEGVLVLDKYGKISVWNAAAQRFLNVKESLENRVLDQLVQFEDKKGIPILFADMLPEDDAKRRNRDDVQLNYSDRDHATFSVRVSPLHTTFSGGQDYTGYIMTLRDITKQKSLEEERNEFVSVISHELRTPLTVMEGGLSNALLINEKNGADEAMQKTLTTAHNQIVMLESVLNDLATFAEAENNSLDLIKTELNPQSMVERLEREFTRKAEEKGLKLKVAHSKELPKSILSNNNYVYEILNNLVSNAVKYSEEGTITIDVHKTAHNHLAFSVRDQGLGIAVTEQHRVFDKFYRSEDFRTRASGGTGLGLYISQKLATILGGKLTLKSELGKGSTFTLVIPPLHPEKMKNMSDVLASEEIKKAHSVVSGLPVVAPVQ